MVFPKAGGAERRGAVESKPPAGRKALLSWGTVIVHAALLCHARMEKPRVTGKEKASRNLSRECRGRRIDTAVSPHEAPGNHEN